MRPIHDAQLGGLCPVLVLTRELVRPHLGTVTVAPIRSEGRGLSTELSLGEGNGVEDGSVVDCDGVTTIPVSALGVNRGFLLPAQEVLLSRVLRSAFDLES
ncbi:MULTISPECIES: type II toxin-antitoxin system PemK/MazF family toxin [Rhodococcus]|uniref:PemK-like growth inhibitor n=1 Tax=Rhodococcus erythropolis TaxID=1833 RepID=Q6XN60_RHOER|nr:MULTISPECIES: type II toxin-antitoxin system PemK/MazF family toxin [Rhodococcus]AAP73971.1 PemK-like growth inhibitor [Rhodococcus erythropolis]MDV8128757.1 type II toxin-antitoxin system PemK/MazF family toxin [Rhodococcus sp. IEGM 1304]QEM25372.1 type II toxin-antitoxin system PemK/MazF family toxin [Rhodococcus qingshengii]QEM25620.1 type II toxin-antitoxin system PemK/MazF family toxin [Rhodococcus qingshengii]UGQ55915.1 type II toxin-antitoxin system PemK/MazF family toxin [Rhodococcu